MEWSVPVNEMLKDDITKISHTLLPPGIQGDARKREQVLMSITRLINKLGEQSSIAQGLSKVITTSEKLRNSEQSSLYLLKDATANGGHGDVIGLLRVGRKHLYLFDEHERMREVEPICVLDFYVRDDVQRHGYGRRLFDHMLKEEGVTVDKIAVDGPSPKMEHFLHKNYNVERLIRQGNNFAISPKFFSATNGISNTSGRSTPVSTPAVGRYTAPKPSSNIATVIHGGGTIDNGSRYVSRTTTPDHDPASLGGPPHFVRRDGVVAKPKKVKEVSQTPQVSPKHEFVEPSPVRPTTLPVETPAETSLPPRPPSSAGMATPRLNSQLTDRGYFDIKFYHNKIW